ncbi:MAG: hypothetical protein Q7V88_10000 [Actinomycetota bacterium]|nr:hypothetical protein [Actinomycetota bacterium]
MKLLLIESTPGNATEIGAHLVADGHEVITCADGRGGPCKGVAEHVTCPMEGHIDLTIVAREQGSAHTLAEMGSVCAQRHRVPLVEVDPRQIDDEMPSVTVANAVAKRAVEAGYATAIRNELGHLPALVDVERLPGRVHVTVQVPASQSAPAKLSAVADRARHAVRTHDPYVNGIDVSVVCYPDPAD